MPTTNIITLYFVPDVHSYHILTLKLRKQNGLPKLTDKNDLPVPNRDALDDIEVRFAVII